MSLISLVPIIASFLVLIGKPLSSRNSVWVTCVVLPCLRVGFLWPVSCPEDNWSSGVCSASTRLIPAACHFLSSISENAVMTKRNITGERLSPCRTPTVWSMSVLSFPILRVTWRSV